MAEMYLGDIITDLDKPNAGPHVSRDGVCQRIGTIASCESIFRCWREAHRARRT